MSKKHKRQPIEFADVLELDLPDPTDPADVRQWTVEVCGFIDRYGDTSVAAKVIAGLADAPKRVEYVEISGSGISFGNHRDCYL